MLNLTVKNFGVLKDINIELNKTNLFIGDNGSGKSTLAKLITVITDFTLDKEEIVKRLKDFNIDFLDEECFIQLQGNNELFVEIIGSKIKFSTKQKEFVEELKKIKISIELDRLINQINAKDSLKKTSKIDNKLKKFLLQFAENKEFIDNLRQFERDLPVLQSRYIPAERNLISLFNQSLSNMFTAEIPLPKTLLEFSAEYNSARNNIQELDILNVKYRNVNEQDRVYFGDAKDNFLTLENSSSGIQSALPLYLTTKYFASKYRNIIIEEPELNLYPLSQIDTIKYIIENRQESSLTIMTHSPYILSILNVLLFAYKASNTNDNLKEKISTIIPKEQQINPDEFCAYLIENGVSKSIKGKSTGMIEENVIDDIGGMIDDTFRKLMEIYSELKSDK